MKRKTKVKLGGFNLIKIRIFNLDLFKIKKNLIILLPNYKYKRVTIYKA